MSFTVHLSLVCKTSLSLFQANPNPNLQQQANINPSLLSISSPVKHEVDNNPPHYRQYISYQDSKLQLLICDVPSEQVSRKDFAKTFSFCLPIQPWLRKQFNIIEGFVQQSVDLSSLPSSSQKDFVYKPLWKGDWMYITVFPMCTFLRCNSKTGEMETVNRSSVIGNGKYSITVQVSYIFIGPHKKGEDYSLSLDIVQVVFKPDATQDKLLKGQNKRRRSNKDDFAVFQVEAKA